MKRNVPQPPTKTYASWGRYPKAEPCGVIPLDWRDELPDFAALPASVLPYGYGRSYGDSCLNENGILLDASGLRRFIAFNDTTGVLHCEAGVRLDDILSLVVPRGWFLPVSPGTKFVSVGGAIANDIHGKNHHRGGTWGRHVRRFELVRSSGERLTCSPEENAGLYRATIGGLGLTGLITSAEIQLKPIKSAFIDEEQIRFESLDEFMELAQESVDDFEYTVAWIDCFVEEGRYIRGHFMRGNHRQAPDRPSDASRALPLVVPFNLPGGILLNQYTVRAFNTVYYHRQFAERVHKTIHYEPFFYPLDTIQSWNKIYGDAGFLQYQCVVPVENDNAAIKEILSRIRRSGEGSFFTVFKTFGEIASPGMLSFPRPGVTLALDFAYRGSSTLELLESLDAIVRASGGAVYPAKDARMSAESFHTFFPAWDEFSAFIDPCFSSSFLRRVNGEDAS
ncbi:MAG TPA: FAD-binding oxidoreductase [Nitrolancea sp.]